jgi:sulfonate transport system substrate-binding protein
MRTVHVRNLEIMPAHSHRSEHATAGPVERSRRGPRSVLLLISALLFVCGSLLASCGGSSEAPADLSEVSLKVGVISPGSSARQINRLKSGAFEGTEYSIDWVEFAATNDALPALISGAIDVALLVQSPEIVLAAGNASEQWTADSAPFAVIGAALPFLDDGQLVIVRIDSPIDSLEELAGGSIVFPRGSLGQYCWSKLRRANNIAEGVVNEVNMTTGEGRSAYLSGAVDANVASSWAKGQIAGGKSRSIAACDPEMASNYSVTLARAGLLDDAATTAAVRDLLIRAQTAEAWSNDHQDQAAQTYIEAASQSPAEAASSAKYDYRNRVPLDATTIAGVQDQSDVFTDLGLIRNPSDLSYLFDTRFNGDVTAGR